MSTRWVDTRRFTAPPVAFPRAILAIMLACNALSICDRCATTVARPPHDTHAPCGIVALPRVHKRLCASLASSRRGVAACGSAVVRPRMLRREPPGLTNPARHRFAHPRRWCLRRKFAATFFSRRALASALPCFVRAARATKRRAVLPLPVAAGRSRAEYPQTMSAGNVSVEIGRRTGPRMRAAEPFGADCGTARDGLARRQPQPAGT